MYVSKNASRSMVKSTLTPSPRRRNQLSRVARSASYRKHLAYGGQAENTREQGHQNEIKQSLSMVEADLLTTLLHSELLV